MERLAQAAVDRFGRLDVWVNGSGVMAYGHSDEVPADVFRAVIETNLLGLGQGERAGRERLRDEQVRGPGFQRMPAPGAARRA
jgi:NAD(P)-dependent dehydrogenase (short-subunit alcohol dehydrogenase family)